LFSIVFVVLYLSPKVNTWLLVDLHWISYYCSAPLYILMGCEEGSCLIHKEMIFLQSCIWTPVVWLFLVLKMLQTWSCVCWWWCDGDDCEMVPMMMSHLLSLWIVPDRYRCLELLELSKNTWHNMVAVGKSSQYQNILNVTCYEKGKLNCFWKIWKWDRNKVESN